MDAGFTDLSTPTEEVQLQWNDVDAIYGWFQGEFDSKDFDKEKLKQLKKELKDGPVVALEPHRQLYAIFTGL